MSQSDFKLSPGEIITHKISNNTVRDDFAGTVVTSEVWHHNYICSNSFRFYVQPEYNFTGSDHIQVRLYKYSFVENKWIQLKEVNYLNGANNHSLWINVNSHSVSSGSNQTWTLEVTDAIHFDVAVLRQRWGFDNAKTTYTQLYMGNYSATPEAFYNDNMKGDYIRLKKKTGISGGFVFYTTSGLPSNPFDTDWGNITSAKGSFIDASDPYRFIFNYKRNI